MRAGLLSLAMLILATPIAAASPEENASALSDIFVTQDWLDWYATELTDDLIEMQQLAFAEIAPDGLLSEDAWVLYRDSSIRVRG